MKSLLIATSFLALMCGAACAQQPTRTYSFTVTADEANVLLNQIGEMKWKDANPLLQKLIGQINAQNQPPPVPPATKPSE